MKSKTIAFFHDRNIRIKFDDLTNDQKEQLINRVVGKWGYAKIRSMNRNDILDGTTANAIKTILDNLSKENKNKLLSKNLYSIVTITWKLIDKCKV